MKFRILVGAALSSVVIATSSLAATLSLVGTGGLDTVLATDFHLTGVASDYGLIAGTSAVKQYSTADGTAGGLSVSGDTRLTFTYLGAVASAENSAFSAGSGTLKNKGIGASAVGDVVSSYHTFDGGVGAENLVDFTYSTIFTTPIVESGSISNVIGVTGKDGGGSTGLSMTFFKVSDTSYLAFFGDGRGDSDMDDMVVLISAVPLPAGGLLLLSAFGGFAAFRRRKSTQA